MKHRWGKQLSCELEEIIHLYYQSKHDLSFLSEIEIVSVCLECVFERYERAEDCCPGMSFLIKERVRPKPQFPKPLKLSQNVTPNLNLTSVSVMS